MEAPTDAPPQTPINRALRVLAVEEAAGVLGIDPATLWRRRKKYGRLVDDRRQRSRPGSRKTPFAPCNPPIEKSLQNARCRAALPASEQPAGGVLSLPCNLALHLKAIGTDACLPFPRSRHARSRSERPPRRRCLASQARPRRR
ncbi:MAG: hypothetical protein BRD52_05190 [Bacteroidetes bacterium SW_4_67_19]|nr:MAG: hypothetical protein BRD52_05190 [Bacteroidetes bacterium SW_4_67_19]